LIYNDQGTRKTRSTPALKSRVSMA